MKEKLPRFVKYESRVGEVYTTNEGYRVIITEYRDFKSCDIVFEHDNSIKLYNYCYNIIQKGAVRNPFHKSLLDVGYMGMGKYTSSTMIGTTTIYRHWSAMIGRCYNEKTQKENPTYKGCTTDPHWHCFQNFAKWYEENYNPETMQGWSLDKDILVKSNKIYSPETCCFVPNEINVLFIKRESKRGKYPIGVTKSGNKFMAKINKFGKRVSLGYYSTIEEAFQVYKVAKEKHIKEIADKWKGQISEKTYKAMYSYQVEITD